MNLIGLARFMPFMIALVWYENIIRTPNLVTLNKWFHVTAYDTLYLDMCFDEFSVFIDSFLLLSVKKTLVNLKYANLNASTARSGSKRGSLELWLNEPKRITNG